MHLCEDSRMNLKCTTEYLNRTIKFGFEFFYDDGEPIDLLFITQKMNAKIKWYLCRFYQSDNPILIKDMLVSEDIPNYAVVTIKSSDTVNLEHGKYTHQPVLLFGGIKGNADERYGNTEGNIIFRPHIIDL